MKKLILAAGVFLMTLQSAFAQPVSDRAVIPVAVTLTEILRIAVVDGGNIEFVFNTITDYTSGIGNGATGFYDSRFTVSASMRWEMTLGAEDGTFIGTQDNANTLALNNVGYQLASNGTHAFGTELTEPTSAATGVVALANPAVVIIDSAAAPNGNSGDEDDNDITINWEAGTTNGGMNATALINQDIVPDRYVTNVFLDLARAF